MAEEATFPLLTRTTLAPITLAPEASVTTPWMDAAGHTAPNAVSRMAVNIRGNAQLRRARKSAEIGMIAPSFPSERKWVRAFRTGLLTCAFSSHLPKSEPKGSAFSGFLGPSALGGTARVCAVVASEVKSLAVQTAKATEDISSQILEVQNSTGKAVKAIGRITHRMGEINNYTSAVAASVQQQTAATSEISQNVASAASGAKLIVTVLSEVAGAITEAQQSAQTVLTASESVEKAAANLRSEVESFLTKVAV